MKMTNRHVYYCKQCIHAAPCKDHVYCEISNVYKLNDDIACNDFEPLEL